MRFSLSDGKESITEVLLFRQVVNSKAVRSKMLDGQFKATLVEATMVPDVFIILAAASTALRRYDDGDRITKNLYTDILYHLSPSRNISQALKTFGVRDDTTDILVIIPNATDEQVALVRNSIQGLEIAPTKLAELVEENGEKLNQVYSIGPQEQKTSNLVDSIVTRIACRDIK